MNQKKFFLPPGFRDILTYESNSQFENGRKLIKNFDLWGYIFIEPPIIEFESTLVDKKSKSSNNKILSFLDPLTKKKISLRSDITTQLARIASDRLFEFPKPLRLCYLGDVFRADTPKLSSDRQFKQAGIEIIGSDNLVADIEVINLSLDSLKKINFKKISLDLNCSIILEKIFDDNKISNNNREIIRKLVERKNIKEISKYNKKLFILLKKIIETTGSLKKNIEKIKKLKLGKKANLILKDFLYVTSILIKKNYDKYKISVDLLDHRGFEYYSGTTFSIFCLDSSKEICRGGRYTTKKKDPAVGATFFLNQFPEFRNNKNKRKRILISNDSIFSKKLLKLRKQGWITIQNFSKKDDLKLAKLHSCKFIFKNNRIKKIK
tara:strand:- start:8917 stop:10053 length:1137 start_codon:yes stop_codon:yes gene_type:complete